MPSRPDSRPKPRQQADISDLKTRILDLFSEGYGVTESVRIIKTSRSTYYKHRREDEKFRVECDRILALPEHRQRIVNAQTKTVGVTENDPRRQFIAVFAKTRDRNEAANTVGWSALDVEQKLDSTSDDYDEEFATLFAEQEMRHIWRVEDNANQKALHDSPTARFFLQANMKEKYGKPESMKGDNVANIFWFSGEGISRAREIIGEVISGKALAS